MNLAKKYRADFALLKSADENYTSNRTKPLVFLDNGASTQKPTCVINAMSEFYQTSYANIHRGVYSLSEQASAKYEGAREKVANFINAKYKEVVFTRGTTESINLVANCLNAKSIFASKNPRLRIDAGDEILITQLEHHANLIPWQRLASQTGAKLKFIPVLQNGELDLTNINELITDKTKILSVAHISNTLGSINPIKFLIDKIHAKNGLAFIDAAQSIAHTKIDVQALDADFLAFSGHKVYAPTGIGVLYAKDFILEDLPVWQTGGDMVDQVSFESATFAPIPHKFEAGTPPIVEAEGLAVALDYLAKIGMQNIQDAEAQLLNYANLQIAKNLPELNIIGTAKNKAGIISFNLPNTALHPQDIGILLNEFGVALRTGHHCTIPLLKKLGVGSTARASFALYNTKEDIDIFVNSMREIIHRFG